MNYIYFLVILAVLSVTKAGKKVFHLQNLIQLDRVFKFSIFFLLNSQTLSVQQIKLVVLKIKSGASMMMIAQQAQFV